MNHFSNRMSKARQDLIYAALEQVRLNCDVSQRIAFDPVKYVHQYTHPLEQEIVAIIASSMAFGNVEAFCPKIEDALTRLRPSLLSKIDNPKALQKALHGWKHRLYQANDLERLLCGCRSVQHAFGSLGAALVHDYKNTPSFREALIQWVSRIRSTGGLDRIHSTGSNHILVSPKRGSASKRLMLLLRWMVRPYDGVDLGLWALPTDQLLIPVDTHIHKLSRNLGLTHRATVSWKTAEEITEQLRTFDAKDPVKYDFSLCHLGMLQRCPSRRDAVQCDGCGIIHVCRHWSTAKRAI